MTSRIRLGQNISRVVNRVADAVGVDRRVNALDQFGHLAETAKTESPHVFGKSDALNASIQTDAVKTQALIADLNLQPPEGVQKIEWMEDARGPFVKATLSPDVRDMEGIRLSLQESFADCLVGVHTVLPKGSLPAELQSLPFSCEIPEARVAQEQLHGGFASIDVKNPTFTTLDFVREISDASRQAKVILLPRDAALLGGALNGSAVTPLGEGMSIMSGAYGGLGVISSHTFPDASEPSRAIYGGFATVAPNAPNGYATRILRRQLHYMKALGFEALTLKAARGDGLNGYYTWPRIGFNAPFSQKYQDTLLTQAQTPDSLAARVLKANQGAVPRTLVRLMACYEGDVLGGKPEAIGAQWWKANGTSEDMVFDLRDGSESWVAMNVYTSLRGISDWQCPGESLSQMNRAVEVPEIDYIVSLYEGEYSFLHVAYEGLCQNGRRLELEKGLLWVDDQPLQIEGVQRLADGRVGVLGPPGVVFERGFLSIVSDAQNRKAIATFHGATKALDDNLTAFSHI